MSQRADGLLVEGLLDKSEFNPGARVEVSIIAPDGTVIHRVNTVTRPAAEDTSVGARGNRMPPRTRSDLHGTYSVLLPGASLPQRGSVISVRIGTPR